MAGPIWWEEYVRYIIRVFFSNQPKPYGDGSASGAGRAELTEGMAEAFEMVVSDLKYDLNHSFGLPAQFNRYFNAGERLRFWINGNQFIPQGLFFDLYDQNGVFPVDVSVSEPAGIIDNAHGFPFEDQVQIISPIVNNIGSFQNQLWNNFGTGSGSTFSDYSILFDSYGH